ncbi:MAG TPA: response regulator transcription factor [Bacteroidia bacterium]|jgi:two-component system response regulator DegU|nr:response regulator transcription factor [Bacteroidia bacterium]
MYDDSELAYDLLAKGAHGFLIKNSNIETIVEAVYSVLENGYYLNEFITHKMIEDLINDKLIFPKFNQDGLLTEREKQIVSLLCNDYSNKEISETLFIDIRTVETHRQNIMGKIGARSVVGVVAYGFENNLKTKFGYKMNTNKGRRNSN